MHPTPHTTARRPALLALGGAALAVTLLSASACAQQPGDAGARSAATGAASADSVAARADRDRLKGSARAPVNLVLISDFQCPYCGQFALQTYPKLDSAYVRPGKLRVLFVNYPLPNHGAAWAASEAAMCAGAQGAFWPMHDRIFATQREWSPAPSGDAPARFRGLAQELKLDMAAYDRCTTQDETARILVGDAMGAAGAGIPGTPTLILNQQKLLSGAKSFEEMSREIDALLAGAPAGAAPATPPAAGTTPPRP